MILINAANLLFHYHITVIYPYSTKALNYGLTQQHVGGNTILCLALTIHNKSFRNIIYL